MIMLSPSLGAIFIGLILLNINVVSSAPAKHDRHRSEKECYARCFMSALLHYGYTNIVNDYVECVNNNIVGLIASESNRLKECESTTSAALDSIDRDKHLSMRAYCSRHCTSHVSRTTTIDVTTPAISITRPIKTDAATPVITEADTTDAEIRPSTGIERPTKAKFKYPTPSATPATFTRYVWAPPRIGK